MANLLLALLAYLLGSIPSAYIFGKLFKKTDIRQVGSGNVGAANTFTHIGRLPGALTLIIDLSKGVLSAYFATRYGTWHLLPLLSAFLVILGHNYNIFLGFKGGKGLACLVGSLLVIAPITILYIFGFIAILILIIKDKNTATGLGLLSLPVILGIYKADWIFSFFGLAIALLIITKYIDDFRAYRQKRRDMV